ncbi:thread biopolymer filament subunit gamma isoform X2 [Polypterus senegalus]|uniref:thread biopolymer filament subunit gamma isoform X2 n=1 Tax=Polypterus senegalus TaxID=55291 RepID=UPI0019634868|nr:thread biopolymer filament subunit gamma isoform X2 [Polypterus senegalus]
MSSRMSFQSSSTVRSSGLRGGLGMDAGSGLGLSAGLSRLSLGGGAGAGLGLGGALGLGAGGLGGGAGLGLGFGAGLGAANLGLGLGGAGFNLGSAGALAASPAFAMGRALAAGGMSIGSAVTAGAAMPALPPPLPSRAAEKHTLSTLNDRFSSYMEKVRFLVKENAALEAQLNQLTGGAPMATDVSVSGNPEAQLNDLRNTLEGLTLDNIKYEIELDNLRGTAEELKAKLDFEMGVKYQLENDIMAMKRDIEIASELQIELESKYQSLSSELDFVTKAHEEELSNLQSKLGNISADISSVSMIEVDTVKSFDLTTALNKMRSEYDKSVQQHKDEAEAYFKMKMDEIQTSAVKSTEAISETKAEITTSKKELQGLNLELQSLMSLNFNLEQGLAEAQAQASIGVAEYQAQISSLESAIVTAKLELNRQITSYQELLDVKLALDVEISTYRRLLEADDFKLPDLEVYSGTYSFSAESGLKKKDLSVTADDTETSSIS